MRRGDTKPMSSLQWSKGFEVLIISRLGLSALGFKTEQLKALTDEDMARIADSLKQGLSSFFIVAVKQVVTQYLTEKRTKGGL